MAVLRTVGKAAAAVVPTAQLARLGMPALLSIVALAALIIAAGCWVLASDGRAARLTQILRACRGNPVSDSSAAPPPAAGERRRPWRRR